MFTVTLQPFAQEAIRDELKRAAPLLAEGKETGGYLFTPRDSYWWDGFSVEVASWAGPKARREVGALDFDTEYLDELDAALSDKLDLELAGMWHCHPSDDDQPSEPDDERMRAVLHERAEKRCHTRRALELILTPESGGSWRVNPWVFYITQIDMPACLAGRARREPAIMKEAK